MILGLATVAVIGLGIALLELRRRAALVRDAEHELRGPFTAITLGLEALRRQPVARGRAEALLSELGRAEAALDDLAAASHGRRASSSDGQVRLDVLLEHGAEAWRGAAERAGGGVVVEWPDGPAVVRADRRRLAQAFGNLLANAVEHGGGEVVVTGRREAGLVRVEIADSGAAAHELSSRGRRGRGLRIARRALSTAGGRFDARDRPGGGRLVVAELPLEPGSPPDAA